MEKLLESNETWYRQHFSKNYKIVRTVRSLLEEQFAGFPEAFCVDASRLLLSLLPNVSVVCGRFQTSKMERSLLHVWVFDMEAACHIDITSDQFPLAKQKIVIFKASDTASMKKYGYSLTPLNEFNELFRSPYRRFTMSKYKVFKKTPLPYLVRSVKRRFNKK